MDTQSATISNLRLWLGVSITGLVVLFLAFDGVTKILRVAPVIKASEKLGLAPDLLPGIGILLLVCTAIYLIPSTATLGAILLTGYLGGAAAIQVGARSGAFPIGFAIAFGVLVWAGLLLRDPRLVSLFFPRR